MYIVINAVSASVSLPPLPGISLGYYQCTCPNLQAVAGHILPELLLASQGQQRGAQSVALCTASWSRIAVSWLQVELPLPSCRPWDTRPTRNLSCWKSGIEGCNYSHTVWGVHSRREVPRFGAEGMLFAVFTGRWPKAVLYGPTSPG